MKIVRWVVICLILLLAYVNVLHAEEMNLEDEYHARYSELVRYVVILRQGGVAKEQIMSILYAGRRFDNFSLGAIKYFIEMDYTDQYCGLYSDLADDIMKQRQKSVSKENIMNIICESDRYDDVSFGMIKNLIEAAYYKPLETTSKLQIKSAFDFWINHYKQCMEEIEIK